MELDTQDTLTRAVSEDTTRDSATVSEDCPLETQNEAPPTTTTTTTFSRLVQKRRTFGSAEKPKATIATPLEDDQDAAAVNDVSYDCDDNDDIMHGAGDIFDANSVDAASAPNMTPDDDDNDDDNNDKEIDKETVTENVVPDTVAVETEDPSDDDEMELKPQDWSST